MGHTIRALELMPNTFTAISIREIAPSSEEMPI